MEQPQSIFRNVQGIVIALCIALILILAHAPECWSTQEMPVPVAAVQARFFKKVFAYNKSIPKEGIKIVIVYGDASNDIKDDFVEAFESLGIKATAVKGAQLATAGVGVHAVYLAPGGDLRVVKEFCKNNGILSITGLPSFVNSGDISIGLNAVNDQVKVVVNPERLKIEKQDAAELMRLR